MTISLLYKPLGIVTAVVSLVQGLAWTILTIMGILIQTKMWIPNTSVLSYGNLLSNALIVRYLTGSSTGNELFITPKEFFIWLILYLALSVLWIIISSVVLWIIFEEHVEIVKNTYLILGIWIFIICICDIILVSLLATDYHTIVKRVDSFTNEINELSIAILACGIVMVLAGKGFVLWIVNFILAIVMIKMYFDIPSKMPPENFESVKNPFVAFEKSDSSFGTFHGLPRLPPIQSTNERLANLNIITTSSPLGHPNFYSSSYEENETDTNSMGSYVQPPLKSALRNRY